MPNDRLQELVDEDVTFLYNQGRHLDPRVQMSICSANIQYLNSPDATDKTREVHYSIADTVYLKHVWMGVAEKVRDRAKENPKEFR